jgi:hypothetical protein
MYTIFQSYLLYTYILYITRLNAGRKASNFLGRGGGGGENFDALVPAFSRVMVFMFILFNRFFNRIYII